MSRKKQIFCIEGVHEGLGHDEATIEPILSFLQKGGYWDYEYRTCATAAELEYRLKTEWNKGRANGSVLYFFTHGGPDEVWLSEQGVGLNKLREWIKANGCHVHFGGCNTFKGSSQSLEDFMAATEATSVSGYRRQSDWIDGRTPAVLIELQLFGLLSDTKFAKSRPDRAKDLRKVKNQINRNFKDCGFEMLVRR